MRRASCSCNRWPLLAASVLTVVVAATSGFAAKPSLSVAWTDRPIAIDADLDHWSGQLVPSSDAPLSIGVANDAGLEMKAKLDNARLAYELKVPLRRSSAHPYCLNAAPGGKFALEIENPEPQESGSGGQGGGNYGGMGGHHGTMGGTGGGDRGERSATSRPPNISVKAKLQLAKATSPH